MTFLEVNKINGSNMAYKGPFQPKNPAKYKGDPTKIIYRSRWELMVMQRLDSHPDVLQWSSEEVVIPYVSPIDNRYHRYFMDFYMKRKNKQGKIEEILIEVKPLAQTKPPTVQNKPTKRYITEVQTWGVNSAKWEAAREYCKNRGWQFQIITEKELGLNF
jgi:hypothetical protein